MTSENFVYTTPDGKTVELLQFDVMPSGVFRRARNLDEMSATFSLLEAGAVGDSLDVIDALPLPALNDLFAAWTGKAGTDLPKS